MAEHRVSAVIVNYNAGDHLVRCVQSLHAAGVTEVVVVDNDSHDGSPDLVAGGDARVIRTGTNLGFGRAANRGVTATSSEHVLVLNPDTEVEPGAVKALADWLDAHPDAAVVGPRIVRPDGSLYPSARSFPNLADAAGHAFLGIFAPRNRFTTRYRMLDWDHAAAREVDWVSGACFAARRRAWDQVGGFDPRYFMYAEDVDLCWRLWRAGWRVGYEPEALVVHVGSVSTNLRPFRMIAEHHRSLFRFARRSSSWPRTLLLPFVASGLVVRTLLAWAQRLGERRHPRRGSQ